MTLDLLALPTRRRTAVIVAFFAAYTALVYLGYALKENPQSLTIIWPAEGLLVVAFWWTPYRQWLLVLALQLAAENLVYRALGNPWDWGWESLLNLANFVDATVAAALIKPLILRPSHAHVAQVVRAFGALAVGAAVGAFLGAWAATHAFADADYVRQWQIWWAGNLLGSLTIAPLALVWAIRFRVPALAAGPANRMNLILLAVAIVGGAFWIFSVPAGQASTLLQLPFVLILLVVVAALALPPRWTTTLVVAAVLTAAWLASRGLGPFGDDPALLSRIGTLQWFLACLVVMPFLVGVGLLERIRVSQTLVESEERYRNFISLSSEAVWRVEIDPPLPLELTVAEQVAWLRQHSRVAECNEAFKQLDESKIQATDSSPQRFDVPWSTALLVSLPEIAKQGFTMEGLRFDMTKPGEGCKHCLANFQGVESEGKLMRIWGITRDVTELVDLTERLENERTRLIHYAAELTSAEDRARRAIAMDLHDGIAQMAVAQQMRLGNLARNAPDDSREQIAAMTQTARDIQDATRRIMAELSPPGLYDLGLLPALQWLITRFETQDDLAVELHEQIDEQTIDSDKRILIYRVISELLRNVVKHANTDSARVELYTDIQGVSFTVTDNGSGFETQVISGEQARSASFGLWSIGDRIRDAGGVISISSAPGDGCVVRVSLPLHEKRLSA